MKYHKNTNNPVDDEFGSNYEMSEDDYNKLKVKEQKKSMPQPQKKRKRKPKAKVNHFKGLSNSSRGPWPKKRKRNPFMIGSDARPWRGIFGLKKWLIK